MDRSFRGDPLQMQHLPLVGTETFVGIDPLKGLDYGAC